MKKTYNNPKTYLVMIEPHGVLSASKDPEVDVYNDEKYSPGSAYARGTSGNWEDDDEK